MKIWIFYVIFKRSTTKTLIKSLSITPNIGNHWYLKASSSIRKPSSKIHRRFMVLYINNSAVLQPKNKNCLKIKYRIMNKSFKLPQFKPWFSLRVHLNSTLLQATCKDSKIWVSTTIALWNGLTNNNAFSTRATSLRNSLLLNTMEMKANSWLSKTFSTSSKIPSFWISNFRGNLKIQRITLRKLRRKSRRRL
jgi:hypothetical protein